MPDKPNGLSCFGVLSIGLKVIGISLLLSAFNGLPVAVDSVILSHTVQFKDRFVHPIWDVRALGIPTITIMIAIFVLYFGDRAVRRLSFLDEIVDSPRVGLCVAGKLIGMYIVVTGIPRAIEFIAESYRIGMLEPKTEAFLSGMSSSGSLLFGLKWHATIEIGLSIVIGIYLICGARHLWDMIFGRLPKVELNEVA